MSRHRECNSNSGVFYHSHDGFSLIIIVYCYSIVWSGRTRCRWRSGGCNSGDAEILGLGCLQLFTAEVCLSLLSVKDRKRMEIQSGKYCAGASSPGQMAGDRLGPDACLMSSFWKGQKDPRGSYGALAAGAEQAGDYFQRYLQTLLLPELLCHNNW